MMAIAIGLLALNLSACGTVTGAVVGGVAGHELTHGSTLGTVGGAVVGGAIGHEIDKR
ncbi:MAG TPA: glycine zipper 2TM domain-containing protein [Candidatus Competibacteraceae bacterium]|nr:glycine zipper 2TM domain-containing protein [Candidatus Competibacteraceae bacterium]